MKNKFLILFFGFFMFTYLYANAQEDPPVPSPTYINEDRPEPKPDWTTRFFTGGGVGLQFGSYTYIGAFPILGYRFTEKLSGGIGGTYIYLEDKPNHYSTNLYGGKVFGDFNAYKGIGPHIEYEVLSEEVFDRYLQQKRRVTVNSLLVGVSYTQEITDNAGIYILLMYNLIEDIYSPYVNPVISIGFNIGL